MVRISTRPATPDDSEFAFQTRKAAFLSIFEQVCPWNEEQERRRHARRFSTREFAIIQLGGQDVGVISRTRKANEIRVHQLFVLPTQQARGIGTACMAEVIEEARVAGLPIRLQVLIANARAIKFYERLGFASTGAADTHVTMERSA